MEFRTYFVYFIHCLIKFKVQRSSIKFGQSVVCLNGGGNVDGVGKGREGVCPYLKSGVCRNSVVSLIM